MRKSNRHDQSWFRLVSVSTVAFMFAGPSFAEFIQCYTDRMSYLPGDTITVYVSTDSPTFSLEISRDKRDPQVMLNLGGFVGATQPQPWTLTDELWKGAGWQPTLTLVIPDDWSTGSYVMRLETQKGDETYRVFTVRHPQPGSQSRVVFVANYNTSNAYDWWGGASLYYSAVGHTRGRATHVGFQRPWSQTTGRGKFYSAQIAVIGQLEEDGFNPEYVTEWDIHNIPGLLRPYDVVVLAGHHEYISRPIYDALCEHHDRGGHLAFFSANDLWWQVRYENEGDIMVGYRASALTADPMVGVNDELVTTRWGLPPLNRPGEALQGISYSFVTNGSHEPTDFIVQDASHWIFAGTGVQTGDPFGQLLAASETDYIQAASPAIMDIVLFASRPAVPGGPAGVPFVDAAAIYYEDSPAYGFPNGRGGQVFSAGSEGGWCFGLFDNRRDFESVRIATKNIIQHMVDAPHDCNTNGVEDATDIANCTAGDASCVDCDSNGAPDICDLLNCPAGVGACADCNANGILDRCDITACTGGDPFCADCNGNLTLDGCEPDCNANQIADSCDIAACSASDTVCADCNDNGVPDGCEADCNVNGVPDDCDVSGCLPSDLWCQDCNSNSVMDECDVLACGGGWMCSDCDGDNRPDGCQSDFDADTIVDACDTDGDDDGVLNTFDACLFSPPASAVGSNGAPPGDIDTDCDVDLADGAWLQRCFSGVGVPTALGCETARLDGDADADNDDTQIMIDHLTGPAQ